MRSSLVVTFFLLLCSCIETYDLPSVYREAIVIQGMITNQPGPYVVQITRTLPIDGQKDSARTVRGAVVKIEDSEGNSETLTEKSPGNYYTSSTQGVVGTAYSVSVTTKEGWVYQSTPDTLLPVGDFALRKEFKQNEDPLANNQISSINGFNIYLDSEVLPEQNGRVWWRWTGTFEYLTYPQLRTIRCCNDSIDSPYPISCSGYIRKSAFFCHFRYDQEVCYQYLYNNGPCTCCTCWANQYSSNIMISDTRFVNNGMINNQYVGFIEVNKINFYDKYYLSVEQLSISPAIYSFWKNVKIQQSNSSNLFQVPPPKTGGNIKALTVNSLPVVGYFGASAVKVHSLTMTHTDIPYPILPMDTIISDCRLAFKNGTTVKPAFW